MTLSHDAAGTLHFADGATVKFTGVEHITW